MEKNKHLKNTQSFNLQLHGPQLARPSTVLLAEKLKTSASPTARMLQPS
jgi:hypothetical protein